MGRLLFIGLCLFTVMVFLHGKSLYRILFSFSENNFLSMGNGLLGAA
jgi:hypothetical protein